MSSTATTIEWTEKTWNPVRGCSIVSPGCVNCYAMKQAHRFSGEGKPYHGLTKQTKAGPQWTGRVVTVEDALLEPLSWRKPARIFVNSMSDLFHEDVPDAFIDRVFAVMALCPQHTFQILTKRAERMRDYFANTRNGCSRVAHVAKAAYELRGGNGVGLWPLPNVWLGVSCENQEQADKRIPFLLQTPAAVRWVSAEPLLGTINLKPHWLDFSEDDKQDGAALHLEGHVHFLDWVVVGGESGNGARPCDLAWVRSIVRQCESASVPVFVKQLGAAPWVKTTHHHGPGVDAHPYNVRYQLKDRKGGDLTEWPSDLQVREYPQLVSR